MRVTVNVQLLENIQRATERIVAAHKRITWGDLTKALQIAEPETAKKKFNWLIVRAAIQRSRTIKRTPDIHNEVYVNV